MGMYEAVVVVSNAGNTSWRDACIDVLLSEATRPAGSPPSDACCMLCLSAPASPILKANLGIISCGS